MKEATELQEYNPEEKEFKKGESLSPVTAVEDDIEEDAFGIEDDNDNDAPPFEANDHKPLKDDEHAHLSSLSISENTDNKDEITLLSGTTSPLHTPDIPPPPSAAIPSPIISPLKTDDISSSSSSSSTTPSSSSSSITSSTTSSITSTTSSIPTITTTPVSSSSPNTSSPSLSHSPSPLSPPSPSHPSKQLRTNSLLNSSNGSNTPETERKVMTYDERLKVYEDVLQSDILEVALLRELAWQGIPEAKGLRALYWKVLLHYLPANKALWETSLSKSRKLYQDWVSELVIDPHASEVHSDHPLSQDTQSKWNAFFKDNEILGEIDKDVKRTFPHLHFFNQVSPTGEEIASVHYHVLKRILFIYAKLNPGILYVQGMNELLGPIYYTFATDSDPAFKEHAEADAFFCFTNLMSEVMDNFCKTLDKSEMGIVGNMKRLNLLFKDQDLELWSDLEDKKMNPQFYTFRWITLLLSQEFELPDVLRLWDSLFADPDRFNFFYCFCCAMLICVRERLLDGSFADNLKLLQSYPPIDFQVIFATALKVHENTYEPPPQRKKESPSPTPSLSSHSHSHSLSSHSSNSSSSSNSSPSLSKLSFQNFFTKSSSNPSPPSQPIKTTTTTTTIAATTTTNNKTTTNNNKPTTNKPEKEKSTFTLPLGLGKFQI